MPILHIERFENAKSYIYLKRTTLFGGGYIILAEQDDGHCQRFVGYWVNSDGGRNEVVLFEDFLDGDQYKQSIDSLENEPFLAYKPEVAFGHSNYSDFVMTRFPSGVEHFYSVDDFQTNKEHEMLLSVLSNFDREANILPRLQGRSPMFVEGSLA